MEQYVGQVVPPPLHKLRSLAELFRGPPGSPRATAIIHFKTSEASLIMTEAL